MQNETKTPIRQPVRSIDRLTNSELLSRAAKLVRTERKITLEILNVINAVYARRAYAEAGYSSCYVWLTRGLGYSDGAASRRLRSAEMLRNVPTIANKIEEGAINLSTIAQTQSAIRNEEKRTGEKISVSERIELVQKIESCTQKEVEFKLAAIFPEALPKHEVVRPINELHAKVQITVSHDLLKKIERLKAVLSHSKPRASIADIVEAGVDALLKQKDPLVREVKPRSKEDRAAFGSIRNSPESISKPAASSAVAKTGRVEKKTPALSPAARNFIFRRAEGKCEYVDPKTGTRCQSAHFLEVEHVIPRARGGTNEISNLIAFCRTHNRLAAERAFGEAHVRAAIVRKAESLGRRDSQ